MSRAACTADQGSPTYFFWTGAIAQPSATTKAMWDLFNATGSGKKIKIINVMICPAVSTAVTTGNVSDHAFQKTTTVGTGGTVRAAVKADDNDPNLPAQITFREAPTAGASQVSGLYGLGNAYAEETANESRSNIIYNYRWFGKPITLNENQGIKMTAATAVASTGNLKYCIECIVE